MRGRQCGDASCYYALQKPKTWPACCPLLHHDISSEVRNSHAAAAAPGCRVIDSICAVLCRVHFPDRCCSTAPTAN